ncbi:13104_t:CDS:2 [Dentiscutata erythropus]|uniref:13104_t:CDS:1 n=1 Tax=Dentiscutata erythropus TaxID=1348616 RepID=A0A9N8VEI1_9GLOM|nr:13104_t:CDS:2 [Dentiscutata erythropus]
MSDKIFLKSIKITDENNGSINLYGQVIVQHSSKDKEKIVTIEYTVNSWDTGDSVTALQSSTLSNNQELYYFEISTFKASNTPIYLEFRAQFNVEDITFWADSNYEYLYDEGYPKEFFFHDTAIESTSRNNSTEENSLALNEKHRQLEEELRSLEEERKQNKEERKRRQQEEERRSLEEECEHIEREFNKEIINILYSENNRHEKNIKEFASEETFRRRTTQTNNRRRRTQTKREEELILIEEEQCKLIIEEEERRLREEEELRLIEEEQRRLIIEEEEDR